MWEDVDAWSGWDGGGSSQVDTSNWGGAWEPEASVTPDWGGSDPTWGWDNQSGGGSNGTYNWNWDDPWGASSAPQGNNWQAPLPIAQQQMPDWSPYLEQNPYQTPQMFAGPPTSLPKYVPGESTPAPQQGWGKSALDFFYGMDSGKIGSSFAAGRGTNPLVDAISAQYPQQQTVQDPNYDKRIHAYTSGNLANRWGPGIASGAGYANEGIDGIMYMLEKLGWLKEGPYGPREGWSNADIRANQFGINQARFGFQP